MVTEQIANHNEQTIPCSEHQTNLTKGPKSSPSSDFEFERPQESLEQANGNDLFIKPRELTKSLFVTGKKIGDEREHEFVDPSASSTQKLTKDEEMKESCSHKSNQEMEEDEEQDQKQ
jgi:hypothetical protein